MTSGGAVVTGGASEGAAPSTAGAGPGTAGIAGGDQTPSGTAGAAGTAGGDQTPGGTAGAAGAVAGAAGHDAQASGGTAGGGANGGHGGAAAYEALRGHYLLTIANPPGMSGCVPSVVGAGLPFDLAPPRASEIDALIDLVTVAPSSSRPWTGRRASPSPPSGRAGPGGPRRRWASRTLLPSWADEWPSSSGVRW